MPRNYQGPSSPSNVDLSKYTGGFIDKPRFAGPYRKAQYHMSTRTNKDVDPYEYETTAFFEDLYNHKWFRGEDYSNNSQQPPSMNSKKMCDIVTRYWMPNGKRHTLLFSEAKRQSMRNRRDAEIQLLEYCNSHLSTVDSNSLVFGSVLHGVEICFFYVTKRASSHLVPLCSYMDVGVDDAKAPVERLITVMKEWITPEPKTEADLLQLLNPERRNSSSPPLPLAAVSRSSPSYGRDMGSNHPHDRRAGDPVSPQTPQRHTTGAPSSSYSLPVLGSSPVVRQTSPSHGSGGTATTSHLHTPVPGHIRQPSPATPSRRAASDSPPDSGDSQVPARQRGPVPVRINAARAWAAHVAIFRWGMDSFDDTEFQVDSEDGSFQQFKAPGLAWRPAEIEDSLGQKRRGVVFRDASLELPVYTYMIDPSVIPVAGDATKHRRPRWAERGNWIGG